MVNYLCTLLCNYKKIPFPGVAGYRGNDSLPRHGAVPRRLGYYPALITTDCASDNKCGRLKGFKNNEIWRFRSVQLPKL